MTIRLHAYDDLEQTEEPFASVCMPFSRAKLEDRKRYGYKYIIENKCREEMRETRKFPLSANLNYPDSFSTVSSKIENFQSLSNVGILNPKNIPKVILK